MNWLLLIFTCYMCIYNNNNNYVNGLSTYCSNANLNEFQKELEKNCTLIKSSSSSTGTTASVASSSSSSSSKETQQSFETSETVKRYDEVKKILQRVLNSLKDSNLTNHETKRLFLDIVRMMAIVNDDATIKFCVRGVICNLFQNCEFPMEIEYNDWSNDAIVAARLAALLTFWTANERVFNNTYLTQNSLYSLLRTTIADYTNIYNSKIVFRWGQDTKERYKFEATKFLQDNKTKIKVGSIIPIFERDAKNFYWFYKWVSEVKTINLTKSEMGLSDEEFISDLSDAQNKQIDSLVYPTAVYLNKNYRYVSGVTYDCINAVWNRIVSVPFMYPNGEIRGVVAVSISLNNFDLKQCSATDELPLVSETEEEEEEDENIVKVIQKLEIKNLTHFETDPFLGTHRCDRDTTICSHQSGKGFVVGSYLCKCRDGYYFPFQNQLTGFKGVKLEEFYSNLTDTYDSDFQHPQYKCRKCSKGCKTCIDNTPCETEVSNDVKFAALCINLTCILVCIILVILTWYHMKLKVLKTSSPNMLFMVLLGAMISYMEIIPMYFEPNEITCIAAQVLQLEGFLLAYGALVLKTWRECKLFYVRSVKTIKITDKSLFKRLGIILLIGATYLAAWTGMQNRPKKDYKLDPKSLRYETCLVTFWNFISMGFQLVILFWGVVLSFQVRRASIAFKETKLITWAIFNECVVCCFVIGITVLLQYTNVSCYIVFLLNFMRIHLAITFMLILLFSYKIYTIILARQKPFQSSQSSGLLNSFSVSSKDNNANNANNQNNEHGSSSINMTEETERERELKHEIQKLYRQIEEMRSLSMRIANPHLLPKKNRFITYPTKKFKTKAKAALANQDLLLKQPEQRSITIAESESFDNKKKIENDEASACSPDPKSSHSQTVKFKI